MATASVQGGDGCTDSWMFQQDALAGFGTDSVCFSLGLEDMGYIIPLQPDQAGFTHHTTNPDSALPLNVFFPPAGTVTDTEIVTPEEPTVSALDNNTSVPIGTNLDLPMCTSVSIDTNIPLVMSGTFSSSPSSAMSTPTSATPVTSISTASTTATASSSASSSSSSTSSENSVVWTDPAMSIDMKNSIFRGAFEPNRSFKNAFYPKEEDIHSQIEKQIKPLGQGPWREYVEKGRGVPQRPDSALWIDEARSTPAPTALMANNFSLATQMAAVDVNGAPIAPPTLQTWFNPSQYPMGYVVENVSPTTSTSSGVTDLTGTPSDAISAQMQVPMDASLNIVVDGIGPTTAGFVPTDTNKYGPLLDQASLASCLPTVTGEMALFGIPPNNMPFTGVSDTNVFSPAVWRMQPQLSTEPGSLGQTAFLEQPGFVNAPAQWIPTGFDDASAMDFSWLPEPQPTTVPFPAFVTSGPDPAQAQVPSQIPTQAQAQAQAQVQAPKAPQPQPQPRRASAVTEQPKPSTIAPTSRPSRTRRTLNSRVSQSAAVSRPASVVRRPSAPPLSSYPFPTSQSPTPGGNVTFLPTEPVKVQTPTSISPKTTRGSLKVVTSAKHARGVEEDDDKEESPTKRQQQELPSTSPQTSKDLKGKQKADDQAPISYCRDPFGQYDARIPRFPTGPGQIPPKLKEPCVMVTSSGDFIIPFFTVRAAEAIAESDAATVPQFAMSANCGYPAAGSGENNDWTPLTAESQIARIAAAQTKAEAIAKARAEMKAEAKAEAEGRAQKDTAPAVTEKAPEDKSSKSSSSSSQTRVPHPYARNGMPPSMRSQTMHPMSAEELNFGPFASLPVSVPQTQSAQHVAPSPASRPVSSSIPMSTILPYPPFVRKSRSRASTQSRRSSAVHKISEGVQATGVTTV